MLPELLAQWYWRYGDLTIRGDLNYDGFPFDFLLTLQNQDLGLIL